MKPIIACNVVLQREIESANKMVALSNVLTVNVVKHFFLNEEGTIEVLDKALSEASVLAVVEVPSLEVDVALAEAVLYRAQVSLMRCLYSFILRLELAIALEGL